MTKAVNLARHLEEQIESGRYPVGSTIPTEAELQQRFAVSRHTVREALRELKSRGLLASRAGVGTTVRGKAPAARFIQGVGSLEDVIQFGEATRMKRIGGADVIADAALAGQVGARLGQELHRVDLVRYRPDEALPAGYLHMYLRPEHAGIASAIESSREPVVRLIEQRYGLRPAEIVQQIAATTLTAAQARILESRPGKPALYVTRRHLDAQDRMLLATVGLYPSDRFSHNTRFRIQEH
ncbi:MAG TPA: GntR family transcriptional regulator [Usitatibacter sp.]|jgi:DNA-binding GntR family transcriptional regulator|nr:GntR family transcriptional regulator [Usitatibacter sp.]